MIWMMWSNAMMCTVEKDEMLINNISSLEKNNKILLMLLFSATLVMMLSKFSSTNLKEEKKKSMWNYILVASLSLFLMKSSFAFLLMMESTLVPLMMSLLMFSKDKDKMKSTTYLILMNSFGSIPFMFFVTKETKMTSNFWTSDLMMLENSSKIMSMACFTILMIKTPVMLFHLWLTKAHVSASGSLSMILASINIKMGTWGMLLFSKTMSAMSKGTKPLLLSLGNLSMMMMMLFMIRMFDLKTMIAMSSVLHMSLMMPFLTMMKSVMTTPMVMMMAAHGMISFYLFLLVSKYYEMSASRTSSMNKSSESENKELTMMCVIMMFLNMGIPMMANFVSEMMSCSSMMLTSTTNLMVTLTYMIAFVMVVMIFTLKMMYGKSEYKKTKQPNLLIKFSLMAMTSPLIGILMMF